MAYRKGDGGSVNETITKMFIAKIEERRANGETVTAPWRKLWNPLLGADRNLFSDAAYKGSNVFMTAIQGYTSPFWVTKLKPKSWAGRSTPKSATFTTERPA